MENGVTHAQAREIVAKFSEDEILDAARRGRQSPSSLSADEAMAVMAYVWLREMRKMG